MTVAIRTRPGGERTDSHNASVNKELAEAGLCGMTHLATGRVCVRPARHSGSCDFRTREEAERLLARRESAAASTR